MDVLKHNLDELLESSMNYLLLQGPIGPFFTELSAWLKTFHKQVFKINFNSGDEAFYPNSIPQTFAYQGQLDQFDQYLRFFVTNIRLMRSFVLVIHGLIIALLKSLQINRKFRFGFLKKAILDRIM